MPKGNSFANGTSNSQGGSTGMNGPVSGGNGKCAKPDCLPQIGHPCGWCAQA